MKRTVMIVLVAVLLPSVAAAQTLSMCTNIESDSTRATTPDERFIAAGAGGEMLLDKVTGLMWDRCPLGYTWAAGSGCSGDPAQQYTWQEALQAAQTEDQGGYLGDAAGAGWRLPNIKELASIVERRCYDPVVNRHLFPGTPATGFWTSSPLAQLTQVAPGSTQSPENRVWVIDFSSGQSAAADKTAQGHVRLVRKATAAELNLIPN